MILSLHLVDDVQNQKQQKENPRNTARVFFLSLLRKANWFLQIYQQQHFLIFSKRSHFHQR
jgi:hypothetical protein